MYRECDLNVSISIQYMYRECDLKVSITGNVYSTCTGNVI